MARSRGWCVINDASLGHLLPMIKSSWMAPVLSKIKGEHMVEETLSQKGLGKESCFIFPESLGKRPWHNHSPVQDKWTQKVLQECSVSDGFYWSALPWVSSGNAPAPSSWLRRHRHDCFHYRRAFPWNEIWSGVHSTLTSGWYGAWALIDISLFPKQISTSIKYWFYMKPE